MKQFFRFFLARFINKGIIDFHPRIRVVSGRSTSKRIQFTQAAIAASSVIDIIGQSRHILSFFRNRTNRFKGF